MILFSRARQRLRRNRARPRVVMLVKGGLKHDARVRRSAASLQQAGYDVLLLGSTRRGPRNATWSSLDGLKLKVVALPHTEPTRSERRVARWLTRLQSRSDRLRQWLRALDQQVPTGRPSLSNRVRRRTLRRLHAGTKETIRRLRRRERQLSTAMRERRALEDPHGLARYERAWWPLVRKLRPDVVHVHDVSGLSTARRAAHRGARWIYDAHESKQHYGEEGAEVAARRQVVEQASHADAVIATNAFHAEVLAKELGLTRTPAVVHNTPPLELGPAPEPGLREAAGVTAAEPLLVYAGVLTRHRRLDVVVQALTMLPEAVLALAVSPDDPFTIELLDLAERAQVSSRVRLVPKVRPESVVAYVAEADVGVNPLGRYPGGDIALPNKLFEYLQAGLPMVVSDSPAMAEFVREHGLGEVVPLDDVEGWAEAISRALAGPPYRTRVSEWNALKEEWSWERQAERLLAVYREVLASPPRR